MAMTQLGNGLYHAKHYEDALSVKEAELSVLRRLGASEENILCAQGNLATTYNSLGRHEDASRIENDVYSGILKFNGEEHRDTLMAACNYASSLNGLQRFEEAKSVLRKMMPVARRVLGEDDRLTLGMRRNYAIALYKDGGATPDDLREAVTTLEDTARTARRVLGGAHPSTMGLETSLRNARTVLRAKETGDMSYIIEALRKAEV